jgi:hypothetical protein
MVKKRESRTVIVRLDPLAQFPQVLSSLSKPMSHATAAGGQFRPAV